MNMELRDLFDENNIIVKKITIIRGVIIIDTLDNRYVIKKKNTRISSLYKYLSSRGFNSFPSLLFKTNNYDIFEYIEEVNLPIEEKAIDIMKLISLLHNKTTFYRDIDQDTFKGIFEEVIDRVNYLYNYYDDIANVIDKEKYMSPSSYLFVRNISLLFNILNFCRESINKWYEIIKEKKRIRVVNLHNNLSLDHYLLSNKPYLISWNKSKKDMPIYDMINFYKIYYKDFDFNDLIRVYESYYPLLKEEKILLLCLISIPSKLEFNNDSYNMCLKIDSFYKYINNSLSLIDDYKENMNISIIKK